VSVPAALVQWQKNLCRRLLGEHAEAPLREGERERAVAHEVGHGMVYLCERLRFVEIEVCVDGSGALRKGAPDPALSRSTLDQRLRAEVGGVLGEEVLLGSIEAVGCTADLRYACARAGVINPEVAAIDDPGFELVRREVVKVREMFRPPATQRAMAAMASELLAGAERLTRDQCVEIARVVGVFVEAPLYSTAIPDESEERRQILAAQESFAQRRAFAERAELAEPGSASV
jgi:hypothetical protein